MWQPVLYLPLNLLLACIWTAMFSLIFSTLQQSLSSVHAAFFQFFGSLVSSSPFAYMRRVVKNTLHNAVLNFVPRCFQNSLPPPSKVAWLSFSSRHTQSTFVLWAPWSRGISCHYLPACCELMFTLVCCINAPPSLSHKMRYAVLDTGTHALPLAFIICGHSQTGKDWHR